MPSTTRSGCREALQERADPDLALRVPCRVRGSTARAKGVTLTADLPAPNRGLAAKGRHLAIGKHKWFIETFSGTDWSHRLQRFVRKHAPLSGRWGCGSARNQNTTRSN